MIYKLIYIYVMHDVYVNLLLWQSCYGIYYLCAYIIDADVLCMYMHVCM